MSNEDKLGVVIVILFVAWWVQSYRLATMRIQYKKSLTDEIAVRKELLDTSKKLTDANDLIDDATATIETASQIIEDYGKGRLKPSYQYRLNDKDKLKTRIEWPEMIEDKEK